MINSQMQTFKQYLIEQLDYHNAKMVVDTLALYINTNKRSPQFQLAVKLAMKHFPQYQFHGKMYRSIRMNKTVEFNKEIDYNTPSVKRALLKRIKDVQRDVYSFTTDKAYAMHPSPRLSCAVIEQVGSGLDVAKFVEEMYPKVNNGATFHNQHQYEQEILATIDPSVSLIAVIPPQEGTTPYFK